VRACTSFGEALSCLRRNEFNLLVIDLSLDGEFSINQTSIDELAGYKLLIQAEPASQPIIVVSGAASTGEIERTYQDFDIFAFVEKQTFDRGAFKQILVEASQKQKDTSILNTLTNREKEVLECLAKGFTNKEIAAALIITPNTVKRHLKAIFEKMDIHTRSAAASMAAGWFASIHEDVP
jgi:two-component system nitrate/nitrite response regulator NarP